MGAGHQPVSEPSNTHKPRALISGPRCYTLPPTTAGSWRGRAGTRAAEHRRGSQWPGVWFARARHARLRPSLGPSGRWALTHQSVIKTTFLLYVTISGAMAEENETRRTCAGSWDTTEAVRLMAIKQGPGRRASVISGGIVQLQSHDDLPLAQRGGQAGCGAESAARRGRRRVGHAV